MNDLARYLRNAPPAPNPTTSRWRVERRPADAPPGSRWEGLTHRAESREDAQAELEGPGARVRPLDVVCVFRGDRATAAETWVVDEAGVARRLPPASTLTRTGDLGAWLAQQIADNDWPWVWEQCRQPGWLLHLAAAAGVAPARLVALAADVAERSAPLRPPAFVEIAGVVAAWLADGAPRSSAEALRAAYQAGDRAMSAMPREGRAAQAALAAACAANALARAAGTAAVGARDVGWTLEAIPAWVVSARAPFSLDPEASMNDRNRDERARDDERRELFALIRARLPLAEVLLAAAARP